MVWCGRQRDGSQAFFLGSVASLALIPSTTAQWSGPPGWGGSSSGGDSSGRGSGFGFGSGSGSGANGFGPQGFGGGFGPGFDIDKAIHYRAVHGILAALAFVVLFPVGAILMRIVPGRGAIWVHGIFQLVAYIIYVAAAALGFWMIREVQIPFSSGNLLSLSAVNYHPIIGIVVLVALLIQPFLGLIHHARFKRLRRRQVWSHLHLWNGRLMIPLGIINGGLGLGLAGASTKFKVAYSVVAAILVLTWALVAIWSELRRLAGSSRVPRGGQRETQRTRRRVTRSAARAKMTTEDSEGDIRYK
ncbi:hypothetical protein VTK73DRAFT_3549 [Phialemonium thermophilum]|uniref:Cytochrome b561 domain-containing protein n=1 Tax=Phialemonium thermophilum TaxID=223376 RepID=A0ABR3Y128_9PEZI